MTIRPAARTLTPPFSGGLISSSREKRSRGESLSDQAAGRPWSAHLGGGTRFARCCSAIRQPPIWPAHHERPDPASGGRYCGRRRLSFSMSISRASRHSPLAEWRLLAAELDQQVGNPSRLVPSIGRPENPSLATSLTVEPPSGVTFDTDASLLEVPKFGAIALLYQSGITATRSRSCLRS